MKHQYLIKIMLFVFLGLFAKNMYAVDMVCPQTYKEDMNLGSIGFRDGKGYCNYRLDKKSCYTIFNNVIKADDSAWTINFDGGFKCKYKSPESCVFTGTAINMVEGGCSGK